MLKHNSIDRKDEREERFGNAMYGAQWIVLSDDELRHIRNVRNAADVSQEKLERIPCRPLHGSWSNYQLPLVVHFGPPEELEDARKAHARFLARKDQLERVRKVLRLLDRYKAGLAPHQDGRRRFDPLERLDPGDDRQELEKARDLYWRIEREQSEAKSMVFSNTAERAPQLAPSAAALSSLAKDVRHNK